MKTIKWMIRLFVFCVFTLGLTVASSQASDVQDVQVGRVYYIEGELLRYIPEENDWVAVVDDAPFGVADTFYSGSKGMTEMIVPNGTWIRTGHNTQIQFIALDPDLSEVDVASGLARIYNKGGDTVIKATSPFGYVLAEPGTVFDFYVGENSVEVVSIKGTVSFMRTDGNVRYNVSAGSPSILADQNKVAAGNGDIDPTWNRWNNNRESMWSTKSGIKGRSAEYLPQDLRYDAHCLDEHGRWDLVPYNGRDYWFWRPTGVYAGWSPFTVGVWTEWRGDQTWLPAEPFGYITHHYGNWIYIGNFWYWAPPVVSVRIGFPLLDIGFRWYPGRVSWIHRGVYVGWVPLAPHETYYSRHNWGGPHHRVVKDNVIHIDFRVERLSNVKRAVIVRQDKFHGVKNYRDVRVANVHPTVIKKYNVATVVNNTVINNYETSSQRYRYANATAREKPGSKAIKRVKQNEESISRDRKENTVSLRRQAENTKEANVGRDARVEVPSVKDHAVTAKAVNRTEYGTDQNQSEKRAATGKTAVYRKVEDKSSSKKQTGQSVDQPERTGITTQNKQAKKSEQTERILPSVRNQLNSTITPSERSYTTRQTQQDKGITETERAVPSARYKQEGIVNKTERATTARQTDQRKTTDQTERALSSVRNQESRTVAQSKRAVNIGSTQQERTDLKTGRTASASYSKQNKTVTLSNRSTPSASTESGRDRLNKVVKSESSSKESKARERTSQNKSGQTSQDSEKEDP